MHIILQEWISISSISEQTFSSYKGSPNKIDSPHSIGSLLLIKRSHNTPLNWEPSPLQRSHSKPELLLIPEEPELLLIPEELEQNQNFSSYQRSHNRSISPHANGSLLLIERSHNQTKPSPHTRGARRNRITYPPIKSIVTCNT